MRPGVPWRTLAWSSLPPNTCERVPTVEVVRAGALTTIQDLGRPGWGRLGVSASGALDTFALRLANLLVGNPRTAPALEVTGPGAALRFHGQALCCLVGADLGAQLAGRPVAVGQPFWTQDRQELVFTRQLSGFRSLLGLRGGLAAPSAFGSCATDVAAALPRQRLVAGEMFEVGLGEGSTLRPVPTHTHELAAALLAEAVPPLRRPSSPYVLSLRFVPWPGARADSEGGLVGPRFQVDARANRTGMRLRPGVPLPTTVRRNWSEPIAPGTIQLPPDGHPILLLADQQTLGGYPVLGHLVAVDRGLAGQAAPGDWLAFRAVCPLEARALARARAARLDHLASCLGNAGPP